MLLLEGISSTATRFLSGAGFKAVEQQAAALGGYDLVAALAGVDVLGIRSRSQVTADVVRRCHRLAVIGCFSVGTNQVDLAEARAHGIPVFNAPFSNTRSVAELTIAEIVMLFRRIFPRSIAAHAGAWHKSAIGSHEVRGKTLGIVGYGNIGSQLASLAEALSLTVIYFDVVDKLRHGNVRPAESLEELLATSDVVSLHVPHTQTTHRLIGARELGLMKRGAFLINNSRGDVVDMDALADALRDNHLGGAAVDVFPVEPQSPGEAFHSPLQGMDNVILTPHIGGSTCEAQDRIGGEVARKLVDYVASGATVGAVNFPEVHMPMRPGGARLAQVHENKPGMIGALNDLFLRHGVNIAAQQLGTDHDIGYVVIDCEGDEAALGALERDARLLAGAIRTRLIRDSGR